MGRPLKKETIVKMNLIVETKEGQAVLGKQVGFNKYIVDEEARKIVRLAKEIVADEDAVLALTVKGESEPVLKVLRNVVQTEKGVYAYKLNVTEGDGNYAGIFGKNFSRVYIDKLKYRVRSNNKWLKEVTGRNDYAGYSNNPPITSTIPCNKDKFVDIKEFAIFFDRNSIR